MVRVKGLKWERRGVQLRFAIPQKTVRRDRVGHGVDLPKHEMTGLTETLTFYRFGCRLDVRHPGGGVTSPGGVPILIAFNARARGRMAW